MNVEFTTRSAGNFCADILLVTYQELMSSMLAVLILPFGLRAGHGYFSSSSFRGSVLLLTSSSITS
jgi:hypothetical protein